MERVVRELQHIRPVFCITLHMQLPETLQIRMHVGPPTKYWSLRLSHSCWLLARVAPSRNLPLSRSRVLPTPAAYAAEGAGAAGVGPVELIQLLTSVAARAAVGEFHLRGEPTRAAEPTTEV